MSTTRIYEVPFVATEKDVKGSVQKETIYLVEATSQAAAWRFVAEKYIMKPRLPNGKRLAELMTSGHKVEVAKEDE